MYNIDYIPFRLIDKLISEVRVVSPKPILIRTTLLILGTSNPLIVYVEGIDN